MQAGTLWTAMFDGNVDSNIEKLIIQIQRTIDARGTEFEDDSDYYGESEGKTAPSDEALDLSVSYL